MIGLKQFTIRRRNGTIYVTAPKKNPGEHFEDLQMLTVIGQSSTLT